jgi:DNA-binding SARP family transcriptional activator
MPPRLDRPDLVERARSAPVVVLTGPIGHGKTCLAAQIVDGAPVAWFTADELDRDATGVVAQLSAALARAWPDLAGLAPAGGDAAAALPLVAATLETVAGPGSVVVDDAHLLDAELLDAVVRTILAALSPACRLVVCTRGDLTPSLVRASAEGRVVVIDAGDLALTAEECRQLVEGGIDGDQLHSDTGGWPLAVALSVRTGASVPNRLDQVADLALADLPEAARTMVTALARLPRFPADTVADLQVAESVVLGRPALVEHQPGGWVSVRPWLRAALQPRPADDAAVRTIVGSLRTRGQPELAAHLLLAEGHVADGVREVEVLAAQGARRGRWDWVRALIADVPLPARTLELDLIAAAAGQGLNQLDDEEVLVDLVRRADAAGPGAALRARHVLAHFHRMRGDLRCLEVCETALGAALEAADPGQSIVDAWLPHHPQVAFAGAELLRIYSHALLLAADRATIGRGQRLAVASFRAADQAGHDTVSPRAWHLYVEALLYLRDGATVVPRLRAAARVLQERGHTDASMRFTELAILEYLADDHAAARRSVELGRECADRTGVQVTLPPLDAVDVALDLAAGGSVPELLPRIDAVLGAMWAEPRLRFHLPAFAAELGVALVRRGELGSARRYLEQAEEATGAGPLAQSSVPRCRRLRGLIELAGDRPETGAATLASLRTSAVEAGRTALVDLIDRDLGPVRPRPAPGPEPAAVAVRVLGPELSITVAGEPIPTLRGFPAKLLAVLITRGGTMTVDAAIEALWPEADPAAGRNRLHGILLRLRRSLGLTADGPVTCTDGQIRIDPEGVVVDSWAFERAAEPDASRAGGAWTAIRRYPADVLTEQFAYEGPIDEYRRELRATFLRLASTVLADHRAWTDAEAVAALARRATRLAPDDEHLSLLAAQALLDLNRPRQAWAVVDATAHALIDLGIDGRPFARAAESILDRCRAVTVRR